MPRNSRFRRWMLAGGGVCSLLLGSLVGVATTPRGASAGPPCWGRGSCCPGDCSGCGCDGGPGVGEFGGTWYWVRSPDEEKRVIAGLYNRYCIRCHGVDGRGVWDIPGVPDFTNGRWQACRSDAALARIILEGRGAIMPPFRGTLTLEEAWAMARYLRTFLPEAAAPRPDLGPPTKSPAKPLVPVPAPGKPETSSK